MLSIDILIRYELTVVLKKETKLQLRSALLLVPWVDSTWKLLPRVMNK